MPESGQVQGHGEVHEEGRQEMMGRMNMGRQIATAPASRAAGMSGGMRRMEMQEESAPERMAKGGMVKGYAKGGKVNRGDGCCMKGRTKGKMY